MIKNSYIFIYVYIFFYHIEFDHPCFFHSLLLQQMSHSASSARNNSRHLKTFWSTCTLRDTNRRYKSCLFKSDLENVFCCLSSPLCPFSPMFLFCCVTAAGKRLRRLGEADGVGHSRIFIRERGGRWGGWRDGH